MAFDPYRNSEPSRAMRAGLIAIDRGSRVINLDDWMQAATAPPRTLTTDEERKLRSISVCDEVVLKVVAERASTIARGPLGTESIADRIRKRMRRPPAG